jgi:hypothetical protein
MRRTKSQDFKFIMDKIWGKLKGWKERNLSFAGRSVLISAVIQAIPTYMMSCFLIPKDICSQIERAICNFWWGEKKVSTRFIGRPEKIYSSLNSVEGWGSEICTYSTLLC